MTSIVVEEAGNTVYDSRDNCNAIIETASNILIAGCKNTTIPNSVTTIGDDAFYSCNGLTSVTIPNSVTSIGDYAFFNCYGLTSIVVEAGNTVYDSRDNCNAIIETASNELICGCKNTTIPNSVTSIGGSAFYGCSGLTSITIPNSVTSIGDDAFSNCSGLTSVTIGNSVTTIGNYAFYACSNLRTIYCQPTTPPSARATYVFANEALQYATLYVPTGTKSAYESVDPWRNFWNIVEMDFTESGGINGIEDDYAETDITINNGEIVINNAENVCVEVYSLAGQQVYSNRSYNGESICLDKGMYIIKIGDKTQKVVL